MKTRDFNYLPAVRLGRRKQGLIYYLSHNYHNLPPKKREIFCVPKIPGQVEGIFFLWFERNTAGVSGRRRLFSPAVRLAELEPGV